MRRIIAWLFPAPVGVGDVLPQGEVVRIYRAEWGIYVADVLRDNRTYVYRLDDL